MAGSATRGLHGLTIGANLKRIRFVGEGLKGRPMKM